MEESCFGKCRRKRSTAGKAESKGQSSASCSLLPSEKKLYNAEGSADSAQSLRTYVRTSTYIYICMAAYTWP